MKLPRKGSFLFLAIYVTLWYNGMNITRGINMEEIITDVKAKIVQLVAEMNMAGQPDAYGMGQIAAYADTVAMMQSECVKDCIEDVVEAVEELRKVDVSYLSAKDKAILSGFLAMMPQFNTPVME